MTDNRRSWTHPPETEAVLAVGSITLFSIMTGVVVFHVVPPENEKYVMLLLGALIGIVKDTFGRYFQATKGAQEQRVETARVAATLAEAAAAGKDAGGGTRTLQADTINASGETVNVEQKP